MHSKIDKQDLNEKGGFNFKRSKEEVFSKYLSKKEVAKKMPTDRQKIINKSVSTNLGKASRLGRKGAPGISYKELTPKEKHYRLSHGERESKRLHAFESSGYGKHLSEREKRRGETN